jgi:hypothetical protein
VADFDDIDALLSGSLKSAAEPANSAGVADLIRSRVAAGDAGTTVAGSTAPGWGGGASGILTIVAPLALIVIAGVTGGALGASGIVGAPPAPADGTVPAYVITPDQAPAYLCPDGPRAGELTANTRVFAVARDDDGEWLGVRDPADRNRVLWFVADDIAIDAGAVDPATLPVMGCPEPEVTIVEPEPTPEPTEEPTDEPDDDTPPPPPTPGDTTPPSIKVGSWNPESLVGLQFGYCNNTSQITVNAADNVGIANVTGVSNRPASPVTLVSSGGGTWVFKITGGNYTSNTPTTITVTFTATDTSGLTATGSRSIPIYNSCLI